MNRLRFIRAGATAVALSLLFLLVYGGCNAVTALRPDVGTCAFAWERHIPFVPLFIVPYMSIDLSFVAAPFLCATDEERRRLARRIALAILVAGACFLRFPLQFAFERPAAEGVLGAVFDWFRAMDQPYNLAPSLHIALRTILAALYARHTRGFLRVASHVWFSLVGLSTVLVWQHHVFDVATGFILAGYCFVVFTENPATIGVVANHRAGWIYAVGSAVAVAIAWILRPWGVLFLWPAAALAIMSTACWWLGPAVFRKEAGRLPWTTRFALGPILAGQWLSLRHYSRQCRPWDEVTPRVWIGRVLTDREAADAVARGVSAVLDLTGEFSEARPFRSVHYCNVPVLDLTAPTLEQLRAMSDFITGESVRGVVYVHCKIGYSRSAAAVGAWLMLSGRADDAGAAIAWLRRVRPQIVVRPEITAALAQISNRIRSTV